MSGLGGEVAIKIFTLAVALVALPAVAQSQPDTPEKEALSAVMDCVGRQAILLDDHTSDAHTIGVAAAAQCGAQADYALNVFAHGNEHVAMMMSDKFHQRIADLATGEVLQERALKVRAGK